MECEDSDQTNNNSMELENTQQRKLFYRQLLNLVETIHEKEELGLETVREIGHIIKQLTIIESEHNINDRYQYPEEIFWDSKVLSSASGILKKCLESVDVNVLTYVPSEFAEKIATFCNPDGDFDAQDLLKLLPDVQQIIRQVPEYNFVYGTYDMQNLPKPKERKQRQKREKENFQKKEPEKVTNVEKEEQGIDEIVKMLYDVLTECYERNHERPVKYYDYVVDTSSFSTTVENMFYCSFLIRDGRAHMDLDSKGEPYIKPMKKRQLKQFRDNGGINSQIISAITLPEWEMFNKEGYIQKYKAQK
ncbi:non-structural maintenance of chromosomes element 4 homolog A [Tribolium madens]|uniref:non-structural maintenance of chromosomes element 4 homolog A n=1 Tax=Tribolium madens TaxID=41895 RepID=UPI001CF72017|nr:non-structural maintenance of chromosomes element 4 homolog A [Tribolium madens]